MHFSLLIKQCGLHVHSLCGSFLLLSISLYDLLFERGKYSKMLLPSFGPLELVVTTVSVVSDVREVYKIQSQPFKNRRIWLPQEG